MTDVRLVIGGLAYGGWEQIHVQLGMEQLAGCFDLTVIDRWPDMETPCPITPGQPCRLEVNGDDIITGYVDDVEVDVSANQRSINVRGRDKTGDLVDCSVLQSKTQPGQWRNQTLLQIAKAVCKPFGIEVRCALPLKPLRSAQVQDGESAYELLDRLAKAEGLLLMSDGIGSLLITHPSTYTVSTVIREGDNLLRGKASHSWRERFSRYLLKGQRPSREEDGEHSTNTSAPAQDTEITRYRPLVIIADSHGGNPQQHVAWEAKVRAGRGTRASVTVLGWSHRDGIWLPNQRVMVSAPSLQTEAVLMIASVSLTLSNEEYVAELELADPDSFDVKAGLRAGPIGRKAKGKNGLLENHQGEKGRGRKSKTIDDEDYLP